MISPRVVTKIVQPSRSRLLLHRSRLVDFLHQQIYRKLIILSGSAGYGKTALLVDFAHETNLPVCWYSLDASDRDPQVFLEYLIAAIYRRFPDVGARAQAVRSSGAGSGDCNAVTEVTLVIGALITEIQENISDPFVIILDDYHTVAESEAINHIIDTLLLLLPEKAHLILSSRTLPAGLALTRLAVRQEVAGLGVSELQFTAEEIRILLSQNYQIELSSEQATEIAERSEGWIAGILLTT
jgi:LuxR family transcriptional regulator, maltose regulon positive regulatory protein